MSAPRILIFDSGVGGLSIAACIRQQLPHVEQIYLADNAGFPYGDQPETVVVQRSRRLIGEALRQFPCDVIVVACNTASTIVLPDLRAMTDIPVIGVVPAVKPAAALSENRKIGLLATPATIARPYLDDLITEFAPDCDIERVGHGELVRWIEGSVNGREIPVAELEVALQPFAVASVDTLVLGCTHYPLIRPLLQTLLPDVKHWVDSGEAIARRVIWLLDQNGLSLDGPWLATPLSKVMFSGGLPPGLRDYLAEMNLPAGQLEAHWPAGRPVRSTGSA